MEWVKEFFDVAGSWWGAPQIRQSDHDRIATIERICGPGPKRVLELGAGGGTTACVAAQAGHDVVAVELSSTRAQHMRERAGELELDSLRVVEGDFYEADLGRAFDCVVYWNGFGIGSDDDQRRLLRRVGAEWLGPDASFVVDVMAPYRWIRDAGSTHVEEDVAGLVNGRDFDPVTGRFIDTWWPVGREGEARKQSGRCYAPADLTLLVEGTGLEVRRTEVAGEAMAPEPADMSSPVWNAWEYVVEMRQVG